VASIENGRRCRRWTRSPNGSANHLPADPPKPSVVHGDFKLDNVMLDPDDVGRIVAIFDWEMSALGDPLVDLGIVLKFPSPTAAARAPLEARRVAACAHLVKTRLAAPRLSPPRYNAFPRRLRLRRESSSSQPRPSSASHALPASVCGVPRQMRIARAERREARIGGRPCTKRE